MPPCRNCHSRACFATARQWRGCGKSGLPSTATGSGSPLFLKRKALKRCGAKRAKGALYTSFSRYAQSLPSLTRSRVPSSLSCRRIRFAVAGETPRPSHRSALRISLFSLK